MRGIQGRGVGSLGGVGLADDMTCFILLLVVFRGTGGGFLWVMM
jgi:hypothetical protein